MAYWEEKSLDEMTPKEWEDLCDGCGKCCMNKLEDEDTGELFFTNVACRLFDAKTCQCKDYKKRHRIVGDCVSLTPKKVRRLSWLPTTCAYRLLAEGKGLPDWHHLISGSRNTIHNKGFSMKHKTLCETKVDDLEKHLVDWIN